MLILIYSVSSFSGFSTAMLVRHSNEGIDWLIDQKKPACYKEEAAQYWVKWDSTRASWLR